ncbi:MAG: O-antigen ligase family protein [Chloroflexi bacterium]|nr:O-antigen ligase family protein [Chloroflexota bacterium]
MVTTMLSAGIVGLVAERQPFAALAAVLVAPLLFAVILHSAELATLAVVGILYSNAAVVAVQFHNVPYVLGTSVPVLLVIPLASYLVLRREKIIINDVLRLLVLFLVVQLAGVLFSGNINVSANTLFNFVIEGLGIYFLITNVVRTPQMLRRVVWILVITGALLGGLSLYQQITHTYGNNYWGFAQMSSGMFGTGVENLQGEVLQRRLAGPIGEQNRYAQMMLMLVPLGLFRLFGERNHLWRGVALLATILISTGVALTFSRGAAIGLILMLAIMAFMRYIKPFQIVLLLLAVAIVLALVPQYATRLSSLETLAGFADQDSGGLASSDGSTQSRVTEMLAAGLVFVDYPLIGVGPGMFRYYYQDYARIVGLRVLASDRQAHSLYFGLAAENGILGLTTFLAIVFVTLLNLARTRKTWMKSRPDLALMATGFMLALVSYMITGIFLHFAYIRFFFLVLALAGAATHVADTQLSTQASASSGSSIAHADMERSTQNARRVSV